MFIFVSIVVSIVVLQLDLVPSTSQAIGWKDWASAPVKWYAGKTVS